jgi:hypothetical protein
VSEEKKEGLNQSLLESFIDAYIKTHPGVTREEAAKEVAELAMHHD